MVWKESQLSIAGLVVAEVYIFAYLIMKQGTPSVYDEMSQLILIFANYMN